MKLIEQNKMEKVIVEMEPTGHYWLNLAHFLKEENIKFVVNPMHVKKSKELDDNSKNDVKVHHGFPAIMNMRIIQLSIRWRLLTEDFDWVDCTTNLSSLEPKDIANLILEVNDNATNTFIQHIRRRLSILERPLTTARGDGKSYIYSNFNPKYAQMALIILRTYYNFCFAYKTKDRVGTPAQRIRITEKQFNLKDIIYMQ